MLLYFAGTKHTFGNCHGSCFLTDITTLRQSEFMYLAFINEKSELNTIYGNPPPSFQHPNVEFMTPQSLKSEQQCEPKVSISLFLTCEFV